MSENSAIDFFTVWQRYRKVVDANYMHHAEFSAAIERILRSRFDGRPFSVLDLGCGDASILAALLAKMNIETYEGVDLSEAALALAEQNLNSLSCPVRLTHCDLVEALNNGHRRYDIIHSSYAVHHLSTDRKAEFFAGVAKRLEKDGILLLTDVTREEDESLAVYFQKYCDWLRRDWHGLNVDEKAAICDHLVNNDLPETRATLESQARAAGLDDAHEVARFGWHRLLSFARKQTDLRSL
ncbi:class I SAM-dependent methyltransferase [Methylocapsa acidiphila]|uniref:class I SAM-dependent methyltransferase n=1 Tax=Methylocapsa acidiphila TaxID=133552 RepID=UPI00047B2257|nr:class I SAM-dependent methyltransferase [Methylocapsa acidiphila]